MKTLSLEASKAIHNLGVEVESEKWWVIGLEIAKEGECGYYESWFADEGTVTLYTHNQTKKALEIIANVKDYDGEADHIRAYASPNLQELFTALPAIGEKLGWGENHDACHTHEDGEHECYGYPVYREYAHQLLDFYYQFDGMEKVSEKMLELLTNK